MSDFGEEKKEMANSILFGMEEDAEEEKDQKRIKKKLYNLFDLNKVKMYSLVVGMIDFWEDRKEILYFLLFRVAEGDDKNKLGMFEIVDLWEDDDEKELKRGKLLSLLFQMWNEEKEINRRYSTKFYSKKKIRRLSGEVEGLWKDKQPKLNKEKLYTWLANKVDLYEAEYIFHVLLDTVVICNPSDFLKETKEGVEGAKRELGEILDLITDKKLGEENDIRYFISDVVDMAHRARFLVQLEDSDPFALFFVLSIIKDYEYKAYYGWFAKEFKRIMNELQDIKVSMLRVEKSQNVREMEGGENMVGLEEDVMSLLCDESETTVITGMAGSGKTTLARQVYNDKSITQQFECRAWVCLSKVFSRKEMLVSLIRQMVDNRQLTLLEKVECADYQTLKQVLRQQLLGMRYFIVLDNVPCTTTHLEYVMKALPKGKNKQGSRLLLTTRIPRQLGYHTYRVYHHRMKSMDDDKSWKLLLKTLSIEGCDEEFPKPLVKPAREILRKCGGLPLAIKEMGRNWAKKRQSGSEWEELIGSIDLTETLGALETVYQDWRPELQSCFLHLAFFKEGSPIRAKRLVHIWVVMGLLFDRSSRYILEDLSREFVIDIDMDIKDNIKTCSIHVVFHMLSIKLARDQLKFEILREDGNNRPSHHRAIYSNREKLMNYSSNQDKHLVSLFFYGGGYFNASPSYWNHFEQLKTLDMEDFGLKILPDAIGMLSELRYLGLRNNYIQELPRSLSCLKNLEVFDIALNFIVAVEDIIWEMESLRHLYMSDISCWKPLMIDTLKYLETWTYVSVDNWAYEAWRLGTMRRLTKLGIQEVDGNTDVSKLFASLAELKNLESLILRGFRFRSMPSLDEIGVLRNLRELKLDGLITRLPSADSFPRNIESLSLVNSCLREDPMPILEKLFYLFYLKLKNAYTGQQMVILSNGFSSLKFLVIEESWHLTNVQIEEGALYWLTHLEFNNCPNLEILSKALETRDDMVFKMKTTKKNATKIRESSFVSKIEKVDIQP